MFNDNLSLKKWTRNEIQRLMNMIVPRDLHFSKADCIVMAILKQVTLLSACKMAILWGRMQRQQYSRIRRRTTKYSLHTVSRVWVVLWIWCCCNPSIFVWIPEYARHLEMISPMIVGADDHFPICNWIPIVNLTDMACRLRMKITTNIHSSKQDWIMLVILEDITCRSARRMASPCGRIRRQKCRRVWRRIV